MITVLNGRIKSAFFALQGRLARLGRRRRWELSLGAGLLLAVVLTARCASFARLCDAVREDTLRLHVLANSDSEADQALKLQVRDAVVETAGRLFGQSEDKSAALQKAAENLSTLQEAAQDAVYRAGYDYPVQVVVTERYFATTHYEDFTLPAGRYDAVQVRIGEAAGRNWFCVLYPALCLSTCSASYEQPQENDLVAGDHIVRFAALEWWQRLTGQDE